MSPADWWHPAVEAVVDSMVLGRDPVPAVGRLGEARARVGAAVGAALADLEALYRVAAGGLPPHDLTCALVEAHAEAVLSQLFGVSCEDPLTGLTSMAYLGTRLAEEYRAAEAAGRQAGSTKALVVVELAATPDDPLESAVRMIDTAHAVRTVFAAGETCTAAGPRRVLVLADRTPHLPRSLELVRHLVGCALGCAEVHAWVESLPPSHDAALQQLSELT